jgi:hypothetical protein
VLKEAEVVVPLAGMMDKLAEEQRLLKESRGNQRKNCSA